MGNAGGLFHFRDGVVISVESPGSPGAEMLLLSSGRIEEGDWTAALVESVETRSLQAALVARGIGVTELQGLVMAAMRDGAFATAVGEIERYVVDECIDPPLLPAARGVAPDLLLDWTARRLDAIAAFSLSPYRDCVVPAHEAEPAGLTAERREIVAHATGRRTARDMAFALGRGLHPVTVEIARMIADGLLEIAPPATSFRCSHWGLAALRPRTQAGPDFEISLRSSEV
ncbi:hypothetical protein [Lentzea californiensis]|uniref:hypothetical protein n=1 Tax=Lentzea californiensis TaxID=438851 RepID=UPI00216409AB|nr:hypothetical protein [Lentzea californiensis]